MRPDLSRYLVSLPERVVRSVTGLAAGLLRELGQVAIPASLRKTRLYQTMVDATLRFLIEQVGEVQGVYPPEGKLAEDFLLRRTAGNGLELIGILAFRASPVWVMAALADISGAGRVLIQEVADALKEEGLLPATASYKTADQLLDGLEQTAGRVAEAINTPPLDIAALRQELAEIRRHAALIPAPNVPSPHQLTQLWQSLRNEANTQGRTVFELSSLLAISATRRVPANLQWLSRSAQLAARKTGKILAGGLLEHYRVTLGDIHEQGYLAYWAEEFKPYLRAAAEQFDPARNSLTQRLLTRRGPGSSIQPPRR